MSIPAQLRHIADDIIHELKSHNITIQRYDAITSHSIYLKLDYGVLNSIRISDHHGKKHLNYRYNVLTNIDEYYYRSSTQRFYCAASDIQPLLQQILRDRADKIKRYGRQYQIYMKNNAANNHNKKGFWSQAHLV